MAGYWKATGMHMIADFRYDASPREDVVAVEMFWDHDSRMGLIRVPDGLEDAIAIAALPELSTLPVISAVAYAMVLAAQSNRPLRLSGDRSVWPSKWGTLVNSD